MRTFILNYTPAYGKICIDTDLTDNMLEIHVSDTGKGIAMGDFNRIFDRFYQIEGSSESATSPGTGIGLALTKSIVEKHHGEICLDSQLGKGSVFTVKLPLGDARYIHDEHVHFADREKESDLKETDEDSRVGICAVANEESFQSEEGESKKYTVLVVEDNDELIQVLCELFSPFYQVIMASNGKEGLDKAYEYKPDLIISDIMMSGMDGYELIDHLRTSGFTMPILIITAKERFEDKQRGFQAGTDDYMVKPIDVNEMVLRVGALLKRAKIATEHRIVCQNTILDYDALTVTVNGQETLLPQKEFYLLYKLLSYPNKIFTRQQLMDEIWGLDSTTDERTVDVHVNRLRERFKNCDDFIIMTVRGLGYKAVKTEA